MIKKTFDEYPRNLIPEHSKRNNDEGYKEGQGALHPDIKEAYKYVESISDTSDFVDEYAWHGWALREAFLAGISYCEGRNK